MVDDIKNYMIMLYATYLMHSFYILHQYNIKFDNKKICFEEYKFSKTPSLGKCDFAEDIIKSANEDNLLSSAEKHRFRFK